MVKVLDFWSFFGEILSSPCHIVMPCLHMPCLPSHDPTPYRTWLGASPKMFRAAEGKPGASTMANALGFRKKRTFYFGLLTQTLHVKRGWLALSSEAKLGCNGEERNQDNYCRSMTTPAGGKKIFFI